MAKLPYMQFYVNDWIVDTHMLSIGARGLWFEMCIRMWNSPRRGYLLNQSGVPLGVDQLAKIANTSRVATQALIEELMESGVPSMDDQGCYYCRRMVRQAHVSEVRAEAGKRGANVTNSKTFDDPLPDALSRQNGQQTYRQSDRQTFGSPSRARDRARSRENQNQNHTSETEPHTNAACAPDCERFASEYPLEVPQIAMQLFIGKVNGSTERQDLLFANLALYNATDQWKRGMIPAAAKWLSEGSWEVPPKRPSKISGGKTNEELLDEVFRDGN